MTNEIFTIQPEKSVKFNSQIDFRMSIKMSTFHFFTESFLAAKSTFNTVVGETLTVFSMPQIWKTGQCLAGQCFAVDKTFLEIFVGNYNFLKFREAFNALFFPVWPRLD